MEFNSIYYTKVGKGPHLCFLHGFCESLIIWENLIPHLSENYTCIAIDIPGFGKSSNISFTSIPHVAQQIHALLVHENAQNVILLGHSLGGYIAAEYTHQFISNVRAMGLIHSTGFADQPSKKENRQKTINFIQKHGSKEFYSIFIPSLVASKNQNTIPTHLSEVIQKTKNQSIIDGLHAMMNRESKVLPLKEFKKPILLLHGALDTHYPLDEILSQGAAYNTTQISIIPNAGHLSMYEDSALCLAEINRFLNLVTSLEA